MSKDTTIRILKIIVLIFLMFITIAFSFQIGKSLFSTFWDTPQEVEVPNLIGEEASVAENAIKKKNLGIQIIEAQYQEKYPSNTIIKQEPPGGIMVRKGRDILVVVSLGPELVDVPNLKGQSTSGSKVLLGNNRLAVGKITRKTNKYAEPGQVLDQSPKANEKVKVGTKVDLTVNKGENPLIKVPSLVGKKLAEVAEKLDSSNLTMGTVMYVWHDYVPEGEIIRQMPSPASLAPPLTPIDFKVSAGRKRDDLQLKQKTLVLFAPSGEGLQTVKVRKTDKMGDNLIYEGQHAPGGRIAVTIYSLGNSEIQIFYNSKMAKRIRY